MAASVEAMLELWSAALREGKARIRRLFWPPSVAVTAFLVGLLGPAMARCSVQEIRRLTMRLLQRQSEPAIVIAWSAWRRAHQAAAHAAHLRHRAQL